MDNTPPHSLAAVAVAPTYGEMGWRGSPPPFYPSGDQTALDRSNVSEILPRLYLTNFKGAENAALLAKLGVKHIAAVGEEFLHDTPLPGISYWRHDISDDEHQGDVMASALRDAAAFIQRALSKRHSGSVLVHCAAGVSRSATVVIGFLILHRNMSLRDAFSRVYTRRACVWPNDAFMASLIALEKEVRKATSLQIADYMRWGDYDGPEEPAVAKRPSAAASRTPRPPFGRLKRNDTCLTNEMRELQILQVTCLLNYF